MGGIFREESVGMAGVMEKNLSRILMSCIQFGQMVFGGLIREGPFPQKISEVICSP